MVIADRDADLGAEAVSSVQSSGGEATFVAANISEEQDAAQMVDVALERYGRLDLARNSAGISAGSVKSPSTTVTDLDKDDWDRIIDVNPTGTWLSLKHELRPMLEAGSGAIVNFASSRSYATPSAPRDRSAGWPTREKKPR